MTESGNTLVSQFLGKIYIDRYKGKPIDLALITKAIAIIEQQKPNSPENVVFATTRSKINKQTNAIIPPCLAAFNGSAAVVIKSAILNILSLGRVGSNIYYVTAGLETESHTRYWVRAFACESREHARAIVKEIIEKCRLVQQDWAPQRGSQDTVITRTKSYGLPPTSHRVRAEPNLEAPLVAHRAAQKQQLQQQQQQQPKRAPLQEKPSSDSNKNLNRQQRHPQKKHARNNSNNGVHQLKHNNHSDAENQRHNSSLSTSAQRRQQQKRPNIYEKRSVRQSPSIRTALATR